MKKIQKGGLILGILILGVFGLWISSVFASPSLFNTRTKDDLNIAKEPFQAEESYFAPPTTKTIDDICSYLGITIYKEDMVMIFPDPSLGIGTKIEIKRAPMLYINDGGTKWIGRTWAETIVEYFQEKKIDLGPDDRVSPDPQTLIKSGMRVDVTRVAKTTEKVEEVIYYKTRYIDDKNLEKGKSRVERAGENGLKETIYEYTTENGARVDRRVLEEHIVKSPVDKIVARGTLVNYKYLTTGGATWLDYSDPNRCAYKYAVYKGRYWGDTIRVTYGNKSVTCRVLDVGPNDDSGAVVDLSRQYFSKLAPTWLGRISPVRVDLLF